MARRINVTDLILYYSQEGDTIPTKVLTVKGDKVNIVNWYNKKVWVLTKNCELQNKN